MSNRMTLGRALAFAANVPGPWPLGRRFFVEVDALAFGQFFEAALHRTAVKEPLLAAVVADEAKSPVTNESLDRTARHRISLGARAQQGLRGGLQPLPP